MRLSGLQTDVLVLYRALLKSAVAKTAQKGSDKTVKATQSDLYQFGKSCFPFFVLHLILQKCLCCSHTLVRQEFREKAMSIPKNDFRTIEHLLRYGHKQKKLLDMPGFTGASVVRK